MARTTPSVSHLFFADDSYLFRSSLSECAVIKDCLLNYEKASGQQVNFQKSSVAFNSNVDEFYEQTLCDFFNISKSSKAITYIGMPMCVGTSKIASFGFIFDRIWKRINSWRAKFLSPGGRRS